jgi:putative tryptophan/tyrosine transport system substrate-binding protein
MRRRDFISLLGGTAAWPLAARAQQAERGRRIGVLIGYAEDDPETKSRLAALRAGLAKRGWSEGGNVPIEYRFAGGKTDQYGSLANELLALQPDAILANTTAAAAATQRESRTVPIVFVNVSDPIGSGFIASLAQPGGNLTGVLHYEAGIVGKWLAMLKEIAPQLANAVLLANRKTTPFDCFKRSAEAVAGSLATELVPGHVETAADIERAIEAVARVPATGLILPPDATTVAYRDLIIALAARYRLPAVYPFSFFVEAGGLMSYGTDQLEIFRLAASYLDRILRGDKPAALPVHAPTSFQTSINLKTAKALGLTVPAGLVVAADEVVE